jgi:hypothetical protein
VQQHFPPSGWLDVRVLPRRPTRGVVGRQLARREELDFTQDGLAKRVGVSGRTVSAITVTNRTTQQLQVNPLYLSIIDSHGTKHGASSALGDYEGQIDTTTLAPGEKPGGRVREGTLHAQGRGDDEPAVRRGRPRGGFLT